MNLFPSLHQTDVAEVVDIPSLHWTDVVQDVVFANLFPSLRQRDVAEFVQSAHLSPSLVLESHVLGLFCHLALNEKSSQVGDIGILVIRQPDQTSLVNGIF